VLPDDGPQTMGRQPKWRSGDDQRSDLHAVIVAGATYAAPIPALSAGYRDGPRAAGPAWQHLAMTDVQQPTLPPRGELRRRILAGEVTIGAFIQLASPVAAEIAAQAGFDWLIVDLEHGHGGEAELLGQLHAIQATRAAALVRVQSSERLRIARALDLGADGLMIPRTETEEHVRDTLSWMRFPPQGIRGVALTARGDGYATVDHPAVAGINERVLGVFQVESPAAVDNAGLMAAIEGVDCLFVGPADLSHAMGIPGRIDHPDFLAAVDRVVGACRRHGKAAGILLRGPDAVPGALEQGFRFLGVGSDAGWLIGGARAAASRGREPLRG